jgi:hypothetical protein
MRIQNARRNAPDAANCNIFGLKNCKWQALDGRTTTSRQHRLRAGKSPQNGRQNQLFWRFAGYENFAGDTVDG